MSPNHRRIASLLACFGLLWSNAEARHVASPYHPRVHRNAVSTGSNLGQVDLGRDASEREGGGPIIRDTGNLIVPETDLQSQGEMGLFLTRTFNNYWSGVGVFGAKWQSNFDYKLSFTTSSSSDPCYPKPGGTCATTPTGTIPLWAHRPDGRRIEYIYNATLGVWQEDKPSPISTIARNSDGTYTLTNAKHEIETYSAQGYILSIKDPQNVGWSFAYDTNNYLQTVTHTNGRTIQLTWTGNKVTKVTDPAGNTHIYTYLANRLGTGLNVLSSTTTSQPGGTAGVENYHYDDSRYPGGLTGVDFGGVRYSNYAYDANSYAVSMSHGAAGTFDHYTYAYTAGANNALTVVENTPLGRQTTYTYANGLISSTSATGGTNVDDAHTSHTYDANGYDALVTDAVGNVTSYTYAANGQLQQMVEAYGTPVARTTQYQWDADVTRNRLTRATVVGDHETDYTYDPATQRIATVSVKNLTGNGVANQVQTTTYAYTNNATNGMLARMVVTGPSGAGSALTYAYDSYGNIVSITNSLGQATTYSGYNAMGLPGQVVNTNGATVSFTYNARGQTLTTIASGGTSKYAYDPSGLRTGYTSADGVVETYTYDDTRTLQTKSRAANGTIVGGAAQEVEQYFYNVNHNVIETDDFAQTGSTSTLTRKSIVSYDGLGRAWIVGGSNGQNFVTNYDLVGNRTVSVDSLGHVTKFYYDALGRHTDTVDAKSGITALNYDAGSRVDAITDPRGLVTTYVYDGFGELWAQSSPDTGTVKFAYDAAGRRTKVTRADQSVLNYTYDAISRVSTVGGLGATQTFTYDTCTNGKGLVCKVSDNGYKMHPYSLSSTYTPEGWVASQSSVLGGTGGATFNTSYAYDALGRITGITYPNGQVAGYTYVAGKLSALSMTIGGVKKNVATGLTYQPYALSSGWTYGNGLVRTNNYDLDGRLTGISTTVPSSAVVQSLTFGYDTDNRISGLTNGVNASLTQSFTYDELTRLTAVGAGSGNGAWTYDANGNRSAQNGTTSTIDTGSNQLVSVGARSFTYDANGNRLTDNNGVASPSGSSGTTYHYDPFNRVDNVLVKGVPEYYHVDPLGRRVVKTDAKSTAGYFDYSPDGSLLTEMDITGLQTNYLRMNGQLVAMVRNNALYMIHTDHLGRPESVTNSAKTVVWRASNFAFDRTVTLDNIGGLNLGFPGQYYDAETGLWNNGFRDYDATVGRYIESDPVGLNAGINTYAYVGANPINDVDPTGEGAAPWWVEWGAKAITQAILWFSNGELEEFNEPPPAPTQSAPSTSQPNTSSGGKNGSSGGNPNSSGPSDSGSEGDSDGDAGPGDSGGSTGGDGGEGSDGAGDAAEGAAEESAEDAAADGAADVAADAAVDEVIEVIIGCLLI